MQLARGQDVTHGRQLNTTAIYSEYITLNRTHGKIAGQPAGILLWLCFIKDRVNR